MNKKCCLEEKLVQIVKIMREYVLRFKSLFGVKKGKTIKIDPSV